MRKSLEKIINFMLKKIFDIFILQNILGKIKITDYINHFQYDKFFFNCKTKQPEKSTTAY